MKNLVPWACSEFARQPSKKQSEDALRCAYFAIIEYDFESQGKMMDSNILDLLDSRFADFVRRLRSGDRKFNRRSGRKANQISFFDLGLCMGKLNRNEIGKQIWKNAHCAISELARRDNLNSKNTKYRRATKAFYAQCPKFDFY